MSKIDEIWRDIVWGLGPVQFYRDLEEAVLRFLLTFK